MGVRIMKALSIAVMALAFAVSGTAAAQQPSAPPEALSAIYSCADVAEDAARLSCFDAATARLRQAESEGALVAMDRDQLQTLQQESFGFNLPNVANLLSRLGGDEDQGPSEVVLVVERVGGRADGRSVFTMTDGQRWAQVESQSVRNVRPGDTVRIRRAAFSSYMLVSERGGVGHRVRREE
ncbi:MAG: hypothetical protein R3C16_03925 [Hyphomonadaceae bacterium]